LICFYQIWAWIVDNINNIISATSGIATIVASVVAIFTLKIWRKQQLYSTKINVLMELEDNYEILLAEYGNTFNWIFQRQKLAAESKSKTKEYRQELDKAIKDDFQKFLSENKLAVYSKSYQLAYCRALRVFPNIASAEKLKFSEMENFHTSCLEKIKTECFESKEASNELLNQFSVQFCDFANFGRQQFLKFRELL